jgi:hypothetical protein
MHEKRRCVCTTIAWRLPYTPLPKDQTPSAHRCTNTKSIRKKETNEVVYDGAWTFRASWRTITISLELSRWVEGEATYSVAEATDGASEHDLHKALTNSHTAHIPKLFLAKQRRPTYSVRCSHVSDKGRKINDNSWNCSAQEQGVAQQSMEPVWSVRH